MSQQLTIRDTVRVQSKPGTSISPSRDDIGVIEDIFMLPYSYIDKRIVDYIFVKFSLEVYSKYLIFIIPENP